MTVDTCLKSREGPQQAVAERFDERRVNRESRVCMAVLRITRRDPGADPVGQQRRAARIWQAMLRDTDSVTLLGSDVLVMLSGCLSGEAAAVVQRLRSATPTVQWCTGLAIWDHAESHDDLLRRALRAVDTAEAGPPSLVVALDPARAA